LSLAYGKRSLWDIYQFLRFENLNVNLEKLLDCFKAFEKCKFISTRPVIKSSDLSRAFKQVGVKPGMTLMVHTGVSQFGYLDMGMTGLINQLEKAVGIKGTLCMPTHSLSFSGSNPYNKKKSISTVGALTNAFIRMPDVYRSAHPTHSVACKGPKATALIKGHHAACPPQGETGFWGNFLADDAWVLMMAPMGTNTLIHLAENLEGIPTPAGFIPKKKDGKWQHRECPNMPMNTHWFDKVHDLLDRKKLLKRVVLGESEIVLMRAQDVIDAATVILKKNPYIVLNGTEGVWNTAVKKNLDSIY
ncbi:MAG: AAC(3) family N-acetyltransferase, partial [Lentisphaeria bacterium]|nr:AAC(3) family N-acetyltransferase [Lentisphaeria bacterium]